MSLLSMLSSDLAIDLGTANTCIFAAGRGLVLHEPSVIAFNRLSAAVEAVGTAAKEMVGRTPRNVSAVMPLREGVIADYEATEKMLGCFLKMVRFWRSWGRLRVVVGVPSCSTQVERRAVKESLHRARAAEVHIIDEAMAAAIGAGLPIDEPTGNMVVDIGGGTTAIAIISLGGIVHAQSLRVAGHHMDDSIINYVKRRFNLLIGERTAEQVKIAIGSGYPLEEPLTMEVKGRDLEHGKPRTVTLSDADVREALSDNVKTIVAAVRSALERVPPELSADIYDRGIVLTGGGSLLRNLDRRLREEVALPVLLASDPFSTVALGAGQMLTDAKLLRRVTAE
jgi:rod shape-determining protein MreB